MDESALGFRMDRMLQRQLLIQMRMVYPHPLFRVYDQDTTTSQKLLGTLLYLGEHGLCDCKIDPGFGTLKSPPTITAKGLDFLEEDGGLSAILGVVTVKLHADTVRDLLAQKVDASNLPAEEKSAIKRQLASLSEAALKAATTDLVHVGLHHLPNMIPWLQKFVGL